MNSHLKYLYSTLIIFLHIAVHSQTNTDSLAVIEQEHAEQWEFCTCVIKNDSIQKAIQQPDLSDEDLDRIIERLDLIEARCKVLLVEYEKLTPEERELHEARARECLIEKSMPEE